jgi:hypothetical protein
VRAALAALVLALACTPLCAQRTAVERIEEKPQETKKTHRHPTQSHPPQTQRAAEPPKKPTPRVVVPERPTSPPSQAEQLQQKLNQDRQLQLQQQPQSNEPRPFVGEEKKRSGTVRCNAMPVCKRGGYGSCRGVEQSYGAASLSSSRQDIVRQCVQANTPDSCDCSAQCRQVAHCSIF